MRLSVLGSVVSTLLLAGCGGGAMPLMPDVTGERLDVALLDVEDAGIDAEPEVLGGGLFGVVDESNWEVCGQTPAEGETVGQTPRLVVERNCNKEASATDGEDAPQQSSPAPEDEVAAPSPEEAPRSPSPSSGPEVLTASNTPDLAALLENTDTCSSELGAFASAYEGRTIMFDGYISAMNNHANYDTRYDVLVANGDNGDTAGPDFQFRDVNAFDLNFVGRVPDGFGRGDELTLTAEVNTFVQRQCLFLLDPVATKFRR